MARLHLRVNMDEESKVKKMSNSITNSMGLFLAASLIQVSSAYASPISVSPKNQQMVDQLCKDKWDQDYCYERLKDVEFTPEQLEICNEARNRVSCFHRLKNLKTTPETIQICRRTPGFDQDYRLNYCVRQLSKINISDISEEFEQFCRTYKPEVQDIEVLECLANQTAMTAINILPDNPPCTQKQAWFEALNNLSCDKSESSAIAVTKKLRELESRCPERLSLP